MAENIPAYIQGNLGGGMGNPELFDLIENGLKEVERDHDRIMEYVNRINKFIIEGKDKKVILECLEGLSAVSQVHFQKEENLMKRTGYTHRALHEKDHVRLLDSLEDLGEYLKHDKELMPVPEFLKNWANDHIAVWDKDFIMYLALKGAHAETDG